MLMMEKEVEVATAAVKCYVPRVSDTLLLLFGWFHNISSWRNFRGESENFRDESLNFRDDSDESVNFGDESKNFGDESVSDILKSIEFDKT